MHDPEELYTHVFMSLIDRWTETVTVRRLAQLGGSLATTHLTAENYAFALSILRDPEFDAYFKDRKKAVEFFGGPTAVGEFITSQQVSTFRDAVDRAAIVFMHSALDAAATDLCKLSALLSPSDWEVFIRDRKVTLAETKETTYDQLLQTKLVDYLDALARESLLIRSERLFQVCRPPAGFRPKSDFTYDRNKLSQLDEYRHAVVHGSATPPDIGDISQALEFLVGAGLYLWAMVNKRYGVKLNPVYALARRRR